MSKTIRRPLDQSIPIINSLTSNLKIDDSNSFTSFANSLDNTAKIIANQRIRIQSSNNEINNNNLNEIESNDELNSNGLTLRVSSLTTVGEYYKLIRF